MTDPDVLGEFEQTVLLQIIREGPAAWAMEVRQGIERASGRKVSRGAFYTTLGRLEEKGFVQWEAVVPEGSRRNSPQRLFSVTPEALAALRHTRGVLAARWTELDAALEDV